MTKVPQTKIRTMASPTPRWTGGSSCATPGTWSQLSGLLHCLERTREISSVSVLSWINRQIISMQCVKEMLHWQNETFPFLPGLSPGPGVRSTRWVWTTSCRSWASTMPGPRYPSGCREAWWTRWTRCCQCSSRSWAPPCRTRRTRKAEIKRNTEDHPYIPLQSKLCWSPLQVTN